MTRKDFEAIARALHKSMPDPSDGQAIVQWEETFHAIVHEVEQTNSNFDFQKFSRACGRVTQ